MFTGLPCRAGGIRLDGDRDNQLGTGIGGNTFLRGRCHGVLRVIKAGDVDLLADDFDLRCRLSILLSLFPSVVAICILTGAVPLFRGDGFCCVSILRDI